MLSESYDIQYGIFDHNLSVDQPYSLVELHDKERLDRVSPLYELMRVFVEKKILKHFGISFDKFIELPRDWTKELFEIAGKLNEEEDKIRSETEKELAELGLTNH